MNSEHYPTVDISFIISLLKSNSKVQGVIIQGKTTSYILKGTKPIGERTICIRSTDGQVVYDFAMAIGIKLKCLEEITAWLLQHKNWKDGAYTTKGRPTAASTEITDQDSAQPGSSAQ